MFEKVIREISHERPDIEHIGLHFFGEPLLNPNFFDLVEIARSYLPNTTIAVSSNANALSSEKIDRLINSSLDSFGVWPDATNPELYENIRLGGNLKKVESAILELLEKRRERGKENIEIHVGMILYRNNISFLKEFLDRWTAICSRYKNAHVFVAESHDWAGQVAADNVINSARRGIVHIKSICQVPFETCIVTSEGDITPCCFDCNLRLTWGNIKNTSIRDIWNGAKARELRKKMLTGKIMMTDLCYSCPNYRQSISDLLYSSLTGKIPGIDRVFKKKYSGYYFSTHARKIMKNQGKE